MRGLLTPRKLLGLVVAASILMVIVMAVCCMVGTETVSLKAVFSRRGPGQNNPDYEIFVKIRLARAILAVIVGAALACSGAVFQGLLRNPLADPYILGISSGAGLGAMVAVMLGIQWTLWGRSPIAVFAFAGALGTVALVWSIGRVAGKYHVTGLLLAGVVVNAFFSALIMFLTSIANSSQIQTTLFWLMGNMTEETWDVLWFSGGLVWAGVVGLFFLAPKLNAICLSDSDARSLGIHVTAVRLCAFGMAAMITACAVSLSGLIGFVGLIIPHAIRLIWGPDHRLLIPMSALAGGTFLVLADTVSRVVVAPAQLPVGVVTALVGGPIFIGLLIRHNRGLGGRT
jgi:iron complex transport system permease protein